MTFKANANTLKIIRSIAFLTIFFIAIISTAASFNDAFRLKIPLFSNLTELHLLSLTIASLLIGFYVDAILYRFQHSDEIAELKISTEKIAKEIKKFDFQLTTAVRGEFQKLRPVSVNLFIMNKFLIYVPLYIALNLNFFREEGLEISHA